MISPTTSVTKFESKINAVAKLARERVLAADYPHKEITKKLTYNLNRADFQNDFKFTAELLKNQSLCYSLDPELFFMVVQRPSWDEAPEWANFLTGSKDGFWCWHEHKPTFRAFDMFNPVGRMKSIDTGLNNAMWGHDIFERPEKAVE